MTYSNSAIHSISVANSSLSISLVGGGVFRLLWSVGVLVVDGWGGWRVEVLETWFWIGGGG